MSPAPQAPQADWPDADWEVPTSLPVDADIDALTAALVDIPSESLSEAYLADLVEQALSQYPHVQVDRLGNNVVARTELNRPFRVILAGHLDTVPAAGNLPHHVTDGLLYGLGSCDMKGGVAVGLRLAATVAAPVHDVTYVFYEAEEIEAVHNGLRRLVAERPEWVRADFAVLMEPSNAGIEAGCQGTLRAEIRTTGRRSHSARSWLGVNAIHAAAPILATLANYRANVVPVDGLEYREGLNAVGIRGGVAGNVIPDEAVVTVNYRFAPSRSTDEAVAHIHEVFAEFEVTITDLAPGALPGLQHPAAAAFVAAIGGQPQPKFGWTDVSRFAELGVPAVNFGPGDPALAHTREENVPLADLAACEERLRGWLTTPLQGSAGEAN